MKKALIKGILFYFVGWFIAFLLLLCLDSCKGPEHHLEKFYKKGGKIECKGDTTYIEKVIKGKDGKDSIIYQSVIEYQPKIEYKTRYQIRFDNKRFKDSLKHIERIYSDSLRYALKQAKNSQKTYLKRQKDADKVRKLVIKKTISLKKKKENNSLGHLFKLLIILSFLILLVILALKKLK